jgi:hypothetical protein
MFDFPDHRPVHLPRCSDQESADTTVMVSPLSNVTENEEIKHLKGEFFLHE